MNITLAQAEASITAAKKKAVELNTKMNICVVDAGSNLVAFARMEAALQFLYHFQERLLGLILTLLLTVYGLLATQDKTYGLTRLRVSL